MKDQRNQNGLRDHGKELVFYTQNEDLLENFTHGET